MAQVIDASKNLVKLDNGKTITAQTGGWYDGQQYWSGSLSQAGVIHNENPNQGGTTVNPEVVKATNVQQGLPAGTNEAYLASKRATTQQPSGSTYNQASTAGFGSTGSGTGIDFSSMQSPTLNLPDLYKNLYSTSGISDKEAEVTAKEKQFLEAKAKINDNPFTSAGQIDQRLKRLQDKYDLEVLPIKNEIAMKKADVETQLNLQTKQFDINSQNARDALSRFNVLLEMGALNNASGEDIANITRSTGISSEAIQSAIQANKDKNVKTSMSTFTADNGEVTAVVLDANTGSLISSTSLGRIGNAQNGTKPSEAEKTAYYKDTARNYATSGATLKDMFNNFTQYLDPSDILNIYNASSPYGVATETWDDLAKYGVKKPTSVLGI